MSYSETIVPLSSQERAKLRTQMIVLSLLPFVLTAVGFFLRSLEFFWAVFTWIAAGMVFVFLISRVVRAARDDFFSHKMICKGTLKEVNAVKVGFGTNASEYYELVLEKKILKLGQSALNELNLVDVPLPKEGEEVEIHCLPVSGDILQLKVQRAGKWEQVDLK